MNREIKFRGLRPDKVWIYGNLIQSGQRTYMVREKDYYNFKVKAETIGQFTGLYDKNGKEIYEGDVVGDSKIRWIVKWNKHRMGFSLYPTTEQLYDEMPVNVENKLGYEIIGNVYDNPELLGGE